MALRPFVPDLYEVISLDMDYFLKYGNAVDYIATSNMEPIKNGGPLHMPLQCSLQIGDEIHVDTCYLRCKTPHNTGKNNRTQKYAKFIRSKVKRVYLLSDKYPLPLNSTTTRVKGCSAKDTYRGRQH
jgi:hypothetical protein